MPLLERKIENPIIKILLYPRVCSFSQERSSFFFPALLLLAERFYLHVAIKSNSNLMTLTLSLFSSLPFSLVPAPSCSPLIKVRESSMLFSGFPSLRGGPLG